MLNPVQHAEVRDRTDLYKGIGISLNDPFENFRKNKSHGFVTRMREKAEATAGSTAGTDDTTADQRLSVCVCVRVVCCCERQH